MVAVEVAAMHASGGGGGGAEAEINKSQTQVPAAPRGEEEAGPIYVGGLNDRLLYSSSFDVYSSSFESFCMRLVKRTNRLHFAIVSISSRSFSKYFCSRTATRCSSARSPVAHTGL